MRNWRDTVALAILLLVALVSFPFMFFQIPDGGSLLPLSLIVLCIIAIVLTAPRKLP